MGGGSDSTVARISYDCRYALLRVPVYVDII